MLRDEDGTVVVESDDEVISLGDSVGISSVGRAPSCSRDSESDGAELLMDSGVLNISSDSGDAPHDALPSGSVATSEYKEAADNPMTSSMPSGNLFEDSAEMSDFIGRQEDLLERLNSHMDTMTHELKSSDERLKKSIDELKSRENTLREDMQRLVLTETRAIKKFLHESYLTISDGIKEEISGLLLRETRTIRGQLNDFERIGSMFSNRNRTFSENEQDLHSDEEVDGSFLPRPRAVNQAMPQNISTPQATQQNTAGTQERPQTAPRHPWGASISSIGSHRVPRSPSVIFSNRVAVEKNTTQDKPTDKKSAEKPKKPQEKQKNTTGVNRPKMGF